MIATDTQLITLATQAAATIKLNTVVEGTGGGSDANYFNAFGLPCVVLGMGMNKVHTTEENIKIADLVKMAEFVVAIIKHIAAATAT